MDLTLVALTGASLVVALVFAIAAWRLARDERARSRARVAALSTAASDVSETPARASAKPVPAPQRDPGDEAVPWALHSRVTPLAAGGRAQARAQEMTLRHESGPDLSMRPEATPQATIFNDSFLRGTERAAPADRRQQTLGLAAAALLVVLVSVGTWFVVVSPSTRLAGNAAAAAAPLELVSLRHERQGTTLALSGLIRNPVAGQPVERLSAVVFLFDQAGAFMTSGQALIDFLKLTPGDESPFVIQVDAPATVTRYRVSFRTENGVMSHVDRRSESPVAPASIESARSEAPR